MTQILPKVLAVNEAGTFKLAEEPKMMPAGFIKYKLELHPVIYLALLQNLSPQGEVI